MSWMIAVLNYICPAVCAWMFSPAMTLEAVDKQMRYPIEEEVNRGTVVCNVMSDVRVRYSSDVMKQLRFRFLSESVTLFDISATTGVITTAARIDRDNASVCREREPHCEISLDVVIQPTQFFQIIKIVVEILDINDNTPTFRESKVSLSINEAAVVGSTYIVPNAIDNDGPVYGIQRYELDTVSNRFGVQFTSKLDGSLEVKLVLNSKLDREVEEGYQLKVMACDGGRPVAKTGTLTVDVVILDSNDNKPEFTSPQYRVNISENMPIGSVILKVQAFDRDLGLNGLIGYGFATRTKNLHGGLFGVRNVTGELYIKGIVDHEKASTYQLVVIAQDHGPDVLSSEVTVIVDVEDLNDNAPSVTIRTLSSNAVHVAEISEEAGVNTFVAQVFVFDLDSGLNGRVNCTINEKVFSLVQKSATEYQVFTATLLDRERTERYALTLKCQDGAGVSRVTEKTLTVIVTDVNDNSPIFSRQQYKGSVVENNLIGISVLQLSCYDYDERDNGRIKYVIPGERAAIFHVDQRGVISVHRSIDREIYDSFHFPVFAVDMGSPPRTGSTFVSISVEDTNDELPRFLQQSYVFSVLENEPVGTQVGVVQALDKDGPPYNVFVFAFLSNSQITECFTLDHVTGVVTTQKELDREVTSLYQSVIIVYDEKLTNMSDTATLSISVLDKNDNSPEFIFPSPVNNTISISNRFPMRHSFCQVLARDTDSGRNAELTFTLIPDHRAGNGTFSIDSKTGKLFLSSSQLLHDFITYHLTIRAVDNGNHPKSSSSLLIVNVNASIPVWDVLDPSSSSSADSLLSAYGLVIGVGVVCGCILVLLLLVVAVVAVRQRDRHRDKYNCRMEGLHMLRTTKDTNASCSSPEGTPRKKLQNGGSKPLLSKDGAPAESNDATTTTEAEKREFLKPGTTNLHTAKIWLINKDVEVQPPPPSSAVLHGHKASADVEKESVHSVDGSVTDSGRGPSEEGEAGHVRHNRERCIPPPPPPPRGAYWLQPLKSSHGAIGGGPHSHPMVRFHGGLVPTPEERTTTSLASDTTRSPPPPSHPHPHLQPHSSVGGREFSRTLPYRKQQHHLSLRDTTASSTSSSELGLYVDRLLSNSHLNSSGGGGRGQLQQQLHTMPEFIGGLKSEAPTRASLGEQATKVQQLGASASDGRCDSRQLLQQKHQQQYLVGHGEQTMRRQKTYDCAYDRLIPTSIPLTVSSSSASVSAGGIAGPDVIV